MDKKQKEISLQRDKHLWDAAEGLLSPDSSIRDSSIDHIQKVGGFSQSPLVAYLLISRICEPDLEIRFHLIQLLGKLIDFGSQGPTFSDQAIIFAKEALDQMGKDQLIRILEVAEGYLTAEGAIGNLLKLSSYAGVGLSGIVNDRKLPVSLRQQAIYFCGEVGYLDSRTTLQNLAQRVEKLRSRSGGDSDRKKSRDEEYLYPFVISALEKMSP